MNSNLRFSTVFRVLGWLLLIEALFLLIPFGVSLAYGEDDWWTFLTASAAAALSGGAAALSMKGCPTRLARLDAFLLTTLVWILFSAFGMIPFALGPLQADVASAFFETMSGFTTTGATVIADVESQTHGLLIWRSLTQWIGGLGIVLFILAVLPALNQDGGISMFNAEMTGISHDKLHPRIRQTARSLWEVYSALTLLLALLLLAGPLDAFESACQAMSTLSTGGFSTRNASIAGFGSEYVAWVITLFMMTGGVSFTLLYGLLHGGVRAFMRNTVLRAYIGIMAAIYLLIVVSRILCDPAAGVAGWVLEPLFLIGSAITTTGFSYTPFAGWGPLALTAVFFMMLTGACAGSTTGAIKIDRIAAMFKGAVNEVTRTLFPNRLTRVEINGRQIPPAQLTRVWAFLAIYLSLTFATTAVLAACGYSFIDSLFASVSCIGNNGLGYGATGGSYAGIPAGAKWMLSALMLTGRLELFTVLALLSPSFWKK